MANRVHTVRILCCMAGNKTVRAQTLGSQLRKYREAAKMTARDMGTALGCGYSTVTRWETGERTPISEDVAAFLGVCGAPAEARRTLVALARDADSPHWLSIGMPEPEDQVAALLEFERTATRITAVAPGIFPGMLHRGTFTRAVLTRSDPPLSAKEIDMRVTMRVGRREVIAERANELAFRAFIGENVFYKTIGGPEVMRDQIKLLIDVNKQSNVDIRVIPMKSDFHAGDMGQFILYEFDENRDPTVHIENLISGLFMHVPEEVARYDRAVRELEEVAISSDESEELMASVINS